MYDEFTGQVISYGKLLDTLLRKTGVHQGCPLSPLAQHQNSLTYHNLGSNISTDGGADKDVELCINKVRRAFRTL